MLTSEIGRETKTTDNKMPEMLRELTVDAESAAALRFRGLVLTAELIG
jgi:hypothetical protein